MHTFKDNADRTWTIAIHFTAVKRCRAQVGVDLPGLVKDGYSALNAMLEDMVQFADVLFVLCRDEAAAKGVSDEDFGRAMSGDAIHRARDAFLGELVDFFPNPAVRAGLAKVVALSDQLQERLTEEMTNKVGAIDVDSIVRGLIDSSGSTPVSSASTQGPSPSESST